MKKNILQLMLLISMLFVFGNSANAATIFNYGSQWNYHQAEGNQYEWFISSTFGDDRPTEPFLSYDLNSFDWTKATNLGNGSFGNEKNPMYLNATYWKEYTGLALQKTFTLNGKISNAVLDYGIDNGLIVYINGKNAFRISESGGGGNDEHSFNLDSSLFVIGSNKIQILAQDNGGGTWFDAKLSGDVAPVPEPSSIIMGLISLAGYLGINSNNKN